jgi:hypothetical protein
MIGSAPEAAGVEFVHGDEPGVKIRKQPRHEQKAD